MRLFRDDFKKPKLKRPKHIGAKFGVFINGYLVLYWTALGIECLFFHYHLDKFQTMLAIANALGVAIKWLLDSIIRHYDEKIKEYSGN